MPLVGFSETFFLDFNFEKLEKKALPLPYIFVIITVYSCLGLRVIALASYQKVWGLIPSHGRFFLALSLLLCCRDMLRGEAPCPGPSSKFPSFPAFPGILYKLPNKKFIFYESPACLHPCL